MSRHLIQLNSRTDRLKAHQGVDRAPAGWTLELREPKRSDEQNRALWSLLNQIQRARPTHHGVPMTPDLWKAVFMDALQTAGLLASQATIMPKLDGAGFFPMHSTSRLTKGEFADLLTLMLAWTAEQGLTIEHFDGSEGGGSSATAAPARAA